MKQFTLQQIQNSKLHGLNFVDIVVPGKIYKVLAAHSVCILKTVVH